MLRDGDALLIVWVITSSIWDILIIGGYSYIVFWKGRSGWWFILAIALCYSPALLRALQHRFNIEEEE